MSLLQRYVQREFLKIFLMCFTGLLGIYFLVDFFQRIDLFISYDSPVHYKIEFFLLKVPLFIYHIAPVAVLVAVLVTLGILNRNLEVTAIRSAGVMLYHVCYPLVIWGLVISGFVFVNNEFVVPHTESRARYIKNVQIKGRPARSIFRQNRIWYYGEHNTIFNIQLLDPVQKTLEGVTLYRFSPDHARLLERIDAQRARFRDGQWHAVRVTIRTFDEDGNFRTDFSRKLIIDIPERPEDLSQYREDPEEMNFAKLSAYIRKLRRGGFNPTAYVVDLYSKTSIPLISFVVALMAIPFAFRARPSGGIVASLGISLVLGFSYWILISIGISVGHAGRVSPLVATWAPNVFFLTVGLYLWASIRQ